MNDWLQEITRHGYLIIAGAVFAEAIGFPVPAALALVAGGAAAASKTLHFSTTLGLALLAILLGDTLLYLVGRYTGWGLLGFLCRISMNPETCILRSAESFYKRGKTTLIFAKFIPGVNTMAPPLAGSMRMRFLQFFRLDFIGASLYILAYSTLGFLSRDFLAALTRGFLQAQRLFEIILLIALAGFLAYRVSKYLAYRTYRVVPRIQVEELARRLAEEGTDKALLVDVRSHGYYDAGAARIQGSVRLEPNNLAEELKNFPPDRDIYLYCT
jgi:membrane protein DedA with SNARE-associated domain